MTNFILKINIIIILIILYISQNIYGQETIIENNKYTFWQLTNSNDSTILEKILKSNNFGKLAFIDGEIKQFYQADTFTIGKYKVIDSININFEISKIDSLTFLNSSEYNYKINYKNLILTKENIWLQFYNYNTKEAPYYINREKLFAIGISTNNKKVKIIKIAFFNKYYGIEKGLSLGLINQSGSSMVRCFFKGALTGIQVGIRNYAYNNSGIQIGFINKAHVGNPNFSTFDYRIEVENFKPRKGLQVGLINKIENGFGLQIGLINIRKNNKWYARYLPIVNFKIEKTED